MFFLIIISYLCLQPLFQLAHIQSFELDYVIVGGGAAGLVLANRLTEHSGTTVAVIEAGMFIEDTYGNKSDVPWYVSFFNTPAGFDVEWGFNTSSQTVNSSSNLDRDQTN